MSEIIKNYSHFFITSLNYKIRPQIHWKGMFVAFFSGSFQKLFHLCKQISLITQCNCIKIISYPLGFKREMSIIWFGKAFRYEEKFIKEPKLICLKSPFSTYSTHVIPADIFSVPLLKIGTYISCCMIKGRSICDFILPFKFLIKPLLFTLYIWFSKHCHQKKRGCNDFDFLTPFTINWAKSKYGIRTNVCPMRNM